MQLTQAFDIREKDVVSFVGGGGKTTAMFRLAEELVERGVRVVTTTTTRIFAAQIKLAPYHIRAESDEQGLADLKAALKEHSHVLVVGTTNEEGKAFGVSPHLVDRIIGLEQADVVINEADGSRMRAFKAPGDHEPVIPSSTTLVVPVAGIDVVGAPLDDEHVHRAARVAQIAGVELGVAVEPEHIARVIGNVSGGLKNLPERARVVPLINKAQNVAQLLVGRDIARQLLYVDAISAVAIGAVKNPSLPVSEVHRRVAAIVLAAGGSIRMQGPLKQLLPWGDSTLVRHTVEMLSRSQVAETIVVVGRQAEDVVHELENGSKSARFKIVRNPDWEQGRSTSVRVGLSAVSPNASAAIFVNADQPFLTASVIDTILNRYFQTLASIVVPLYDGRTGSPVMFAKELFGEFMRLTGEEGGKNILESQSTVVEKVNVINARAAIDLDTMDQYRSALAEARANITEGIASTLPGKE